ncbi:MAG: hypothetical protein ACI8SR_003175 [Oceanicoccus sp.]|jgi:hypothetical protein
MYNVNKPDDIELPSAKQLLKSTIIALVTAIVLLLAVILPAEYGVDPTGFGQTIGLTKMGEIKSQLALEAEQEIPLQTTNVVTKIDAAVRAEPIAVKPSETRSIELKPGQAAELKLGMKKDAVVSYQWSVNSGHVNYDTHGDGKGIDYFGYNKGKAVTQDSGELKASFDGKHGWFWRNRSEQVVTVILVVSGDYSGIYRVL